MGSFLGWGRGADYGERAWTEKQLFELEGVLESGLHRVYFPHMIDDRPAYEWSFLTPAAEITLPSGDRSVALPADFNGLVGGITVTQSGGGMFAELTFENEALLDRYYGQQPDTTGQPGTCAIRPVRGTTAKRGQRYEFYVYPLPDVAYTLRFRYNLIPEALTTANPYPYGGAMMREVFLESCLAVAEQKLNDESTIHAMEFDRRLAAAISQDRRNKAQQLGNLWGWNGAGRSILDRLQSNPPTYNGVSYTE